MVKFSFLSFIRKSIGEIFLVARHIVERLHGTRFAPSLLVYAAGTGSLFLIDILVAGFLSSSIVADWASIRSTIGLATVFALLGLDQVIVRRHAQSVAVARSAVRHLPLTVFMAALIGHGFGYIGDLAAGFLIIGCVALTMVGSQLFRSFSQFVAAQIVQQSWKVLALVILVFVLVLDIQVDIECIVAVATVVSTLLLLGIFFYISPHKARGQTDAYWFESYPIGGRFLITSMILAVSLYGEQLVVSALSEDIVSAAYFSHAAIFLFPASAVNGFVAFFVVPWVRDHRASAYRFVLAESKMPFIALAIIYSVAMSVVGVVGWQLVSPTAGAIDHVLQLLFFIVCLASTIYMMPSVFNGLFGQVHHHDHLIVWQIGALVSGALLIVLLSFMLAIDITRAVAAGGALNWVLRAVGGFVVARSIAQSRV